jgi:F0F1-type ATP synthase assembly protein I
MDKKPHNPGNFSNEEKRNLMRAFGLMGQMAVTAIGCIAVGVFLGMFLDRTFDTSPVFILILSLLGAASALKGMIDLAKKF